MKEHLKFAAKVAVAIVVIGVVAGLIKKFTGVSVKNYIYSPLETAGVVDAG